MKRSKGLKVVNFTILISSIALSQQWEWQNPVPQGDNLCGVAFVDTNVGWAVGPNTLLRTSSSGIEWTVETALWLSLEPSTCVTPSGMGWIAARGLWQSFDHGITWDTLLGVPYSAGFKDIFFTNDSSGWVTTWTRTILHTTDGGASWLLQSLSPHGRARCAAFIDPFHGWAVCDACGSVLRTLDGGNTWTEGAYGLYAEGLAFADSLRGWSVDGQYGRIKYTTDGGMTWSLQLEDSTVWWNCVTSNGDTCWVGGNNAIVRTLDAGATWSIVFQGDRYNDPVDCIQFRNSLDGIAVGGGGLILRTSDGGATWSHLDHGCRAYLYAACFPDTSAGWAFGNAILHTANGGREWEVQLDTVPARLEDATFEDALNGWAVGDSGAILHSTNGGDTWETQISGTSSRLTHVSFGDIRHGWVVGEGPTLLRMTNGMDWEVASLPADCSSVKTIFALDSNNVWLLLPGLGYWQTENGGQVWARNSMLQLDMADIWFADVLHGWTAVSMYPSTDNGIYKTTDGGQSWERVFQPPAGTLMPTSLHFFDEERGFASQWNRIVRTTDGGARWDTLYPPDSYYNYLRAFAMPDENHVWGVGTYGKIRKLSLQPTSAGETARATPEAIKLVAYPNPFNPVAILEFDLRQSAHAVISVYDITGRQVCVITDNRFAAGHHSLTFDGNALPSGIYFAQLRTPTQSATQKLVLLK